MRYQIASEGAERPSSPMTAPLKTLESPDGLAGQSLGAAEECPSSRNSWRAAFDPNYGHWYVVSDSREVPPTKANAHLMAAAPDLLEALHKLEAWSAIWTDADNELRVKARAAISKVMEGLNACLSHGEGEKSGGTPRMNTESKNDVTGVASHALFANK